MSPSVILVVLLLFLLRLLFRYELNSSIVVETFLVIMLTFKSLILEMSISCGASLIFASTFSLVRLSCLLLSCLEVELLACGCCCCCSLGCSSGHVRAFGGTGAGQSFTIFLKFNQKNFGADYSSFTIIS